MTAVIEARFKLALNGTDRLAMCGKPDSKGRLTCRGTFGLLSVREGKPFMNMYGILRRNTEGVYTLSDRNKKLRQAGREPQLRRRHVKTTPAPDPEDPRAPGSYRDYGRRGERAGEIVYDFPIEAQRPSPSLRGEGAVCRGHRRTTIGDTTALRRLSQGV